MPAVLSVLIISKSSITNKLHFFFFFFVIIRFVQKFLLMIYGKSKASWKVGEGRSKCLFRNSHLNKLGSDFIHKMIHILLKIPHIDKLCHLCVHVCVDRKKCS